MGWGVVPICQSQACGQEFQLAIVLLIWSRNGRSLKKIIHQLTDLNIKSILVREKLDEGEVTTFRKT